MSHTPGPWEWFTFDGPHHQAPRLMSGGRTGLVVLDPVRRGMQAATFRLRVKHLGSGIEIMTVVEDIDPVQQKAGHARGIEHPDAHLIASAPELLSALEAVVDPSPCDHIDHHGHCQTHSQTTTTCAHAQAKAAIAKARGST